jgi:hypothetical protein
VHSLRLESGPAKLTFPVGVVAPVGWSSVTVTVHFEGCPTTTLSGEQLTAVVVKANWANTVSLPLEPITTVSPYTATPVPRKLSRGV